MLEIAEVGSIEGLKELCQLFGQSFGIGIRKIFPKMNIPAINMGTEDTITLLSPNGNNNDKVVFRYDLLASKLSVVLRYSNCVYKDIFLDIHGETHQIEFLSPIPINEIGTGNEENDTIDASIILNCHLEVGNRVYTVQNVQNNSVRVVADDGSRSSLHLNI